MKLGPHLLPCTKINSKWFKDFNIDVSLLEETWGTLQDIGIGEDFLIRTLIAQEIRPIIDQWDPMKALALVISIAHTHVVTHACHPSNKKVEVGGSEPPDYFAFPWLGFPLTAMPVGSLCCQC